VRYALIPAIALFSVTVPSQQPAGRPPMPPLDPPASPTCENVPHAADHPNAKITNGRVNAVVFLPNKENGYYRSSRFDWSGLVGCASLNGHTFFGEWYGRYDPMIGDAVVGPAEEFRHPTSELGYDEAKPGDPFLKIGVGVLKRVDEKPYTFGTNFPIVDTGTWTSKVKKDSVTFRQVLKTSFGYAYVYEKTLSLDKKTNTLHLTHSLRNIGTKPLDTAVYDHDFFMLDHKTTGPGMQVHFPWVPVPDKPFPESVAIEGSTIKWISAMQSRRSPQAYLTGYDNTKASDYDITVEDTELGIGVEQTSDSPIVKSYFWSTPKTICPEAYIGIHVAPGATQHWTINYRFFTK
jgi:hypothetical protein